MSTAEAATEIAEVAADGVADGMHIVSEEALAAEKVVRGLDGMQIAYIGLGVAAGAAAGALVAFRIAYRKAETKYNAIAAEEIAAMRDHYNEKAVALENRVDKPKLEDIIEKQGYSVEPPMAVTPPAAVVERAEEVRDEEAETPPAPEEDPVPEVRNIFRDNEPPEDTWDWHKERAQRSPKRPYVIHREERDENEAYDGVTYTYYEADDIVCDERDDVISEEDRGRIIGETNLEKFGHGSGDATVVYIRNDQLEMDIEVVRSPNSYVEEVHGFEPEIKHADRRRGRMSFDDE